MHSNSKIEVYPLSRALEIRNYAMMDSSTKQPASTLAHHNVMHAVVHLMGFTLVLWWMHTPLNKHANSWLLPCD